MNKQNKGSVLPILLIVLGVLVIGGGAYVYTQKAKAPGNETGGLITVAGEYEYSDMTGFGLLSVANPSGIKREYYFGTTTAATGNDDSNIRYNRAVNEQIVSGMSPFSDSCSLGIEATVELKDAKLLKTDDKRKVEEYQATFVRLVSKGKVYDLCAQDGGSIKRTEHKDVSRAVSTAQDTKSVSGMSKYTDSDFGFSFWYPSGWTVTDMSQVGQGMFSGTTDRAGNLSRGRIFVKGDGIELNIDKVYSGAGVYNVNPGACGYCGPLRYYFDSAKHLWMKQYPNGANGGDVSQAVLDSTKAPKPADISHNTMGGLHVFQTEQRESAVIVPLSANHFLFVKDVTYTEKCGGNCASPEIKGGAQYLANTIVATDPTVAVPVSASVQAATIQAAKKAYTNQ